MNPTVALPSNNAKPPTRISQALLNITPGFFCIVSILLYNFPYPAKWLETIGIIIFVFNIFLFALLVLANITRYYRWRGLFYSTLIHPSHSLFWGTLPMGFATILNMISFVCVKTWGMPFARLAVGLWFIDAILSLAFNLGVIYMMITRQDHTSSSMSGAWLLPIVSCVVAAASGGIVSEVIITLLPSLSRAILIISYVIWGTGVPLALFVITIYLHRLIIYSTPTPQTLPSLFLPLGPCGQGSFGIMIIGKVAKGLAQNGKAIVAAGDPTIIAETLYAGGLVTGLILWGLGLCFYLLAMAFFIDHIWNTNHAYLHHKSFSIAFTALTFPIGVWATATNTLAIELDSVVFRVIGAIVSSQVVINWIYVMIMTAYKSYDGSLFAAA